jgi:hypothetical protein
MPSQEVVTAVSARLAAGFNLCPVYEVNVQSESPADGSPYLQIQYPVAFEEQASIGSPGSNRFREEGVIQFEIMTPLGSGTATALTIAAVLRTLFRNQYFEGVRTYVPNTPTFGDSNDVAGTFKAFFSVPYDFDILA